MNLTLKQLFKYGVVCLGACALSAAATDTVSDSFEATGELGGGSDGLPIAQYNITTNSPNGIDIVTNYVWIAAEGDASTIVYTNAAYADIEGDGPISNTTAELVLNLETEGNTLSRTAGVSFVSNPVYVDTLIQFTPSEDDPNVDSMTDAKVALWVNAQSNLVVRHDYYLNFTTYPTATTNSVLDVAIDPAKWYRLTITVLKSSYGDLGCEIQLDGGNPITHDNGFDVDGNVNGGPDGTLFLNMTTATSVENVSFQGTGMLDEFVVSDEEPIFGTTPEAVQITLVSLDGKVTFSPVGPVDSGTEVTMTAADWYEITGVAGAIDQDLSGLLPTDSITTTLTASASCSVTATVSYASVNFPLGGGSYPVSLLGPWAELYGLGEGDVTGAMEDDYLLNVAPGTDATIVIVSASNVGAAITVTVGSSSPSVDFQDLNGTLKLYSRSSLTSGDWAEFGSYAVGGGNSEVDITFTGVNPTDFFKAVVE